jgi:cytochrome b
MTSHRQPVWDPLVRIFHWSLMLFFCLSYWLEGDRLSLHSHAGYTVGVLVLFRVVWGFVGDIHAQFSDFVRRPSVTMVYLMSLLTGSAARTVGHNPAGAAMIVCLLGSLLLTTLSGMLMFAMEGNGPLAGLSMVAYLTPVAGQVLVEVHGTMADFTLILILVHVAGVIFTSYRYGENLTLAMFTGKKAVNSSDDGA